MPGEADRPCAPIAFFAYKRPKHTLAALSALKTNPLAERSTLYIYCDGPKSSDDLPAVTAVRQVVRSETWCQTVHIIEREHNLGLANSVIAGVTELTARYGSAIVLEDDLIVASGFLDYMNQALDRYRNEPKVMQVSAYMLPVPTPNGADALFLPFTTSWGWATWQRAWQHFDPEMTTYRKIAESKELCRRFDLEGSFPYSMLAERQRQGLIDSWAVRWYLTTFGQEGLTLYPAHSMVRNAGFDGSGTHCDSSAMFDVSGSAYPVLRWPASIATANDVYEAVVEYYRHRQAASPPSPGLLGKSWARAVLHGVRSAARLLGLRFGNRPFDLWRRRTH